MPKLAIWLGLSAAVVALDQLSKMAIVGSFTLWQSLEITSFFNLTLIHNQGAAFSFLGDAGGWQRFFFIAIAAAASLLIIGLLRKHREQRLFSAALGLILGGALGNLWDRIQLGSVIDFLDFHLAEHHFPAFNLADSAITLGAILLIIDSFSKKDPVSK